MIRVVARSILYASLIWCMELHIWVTCTIVSEEHTKPESHYCVDIFTEDSVCSSDPMIALGRVYDRGNLNSFNIGVTQTIDGTEDEKDSIRKILTQMNRYWYNEVLSNFEYDEARASW